MSYRAKTIHNLLLLKFVYVSFFQRNRLSIPIIKFEEADIDTDDHAKQTLNR